MMIGLIAFAILGGPAIFYGLLAMGDAGLFGNPLENFWVIAGGAIVIVAAIWCAILYIGSRAVALDANKEKVDG